MQGLWKDHLLVALATAFVTVSLILLLMILHSGGG